MSNQVEAVSGELVTKEPETPRDLIHAVEPMFQKILAADDTGVKFEIESRFAYQALTKNEYIYDVAMSNRQSVFNAIQNIASVGLSLNPATSYAYLVPRDKAICLDISYQGLIKIATDSGSIMWAKADLVYSDDTFKYRGPSEPPSHEADVFGERGDFVGVYCVAKTRDGDYLIEVMKSDEILRIMEESSSIKNAKSDYKKSLSPWTRYFGEMAKKACIKRASKTWPKSNRHERIAKAVEIINETEGSDWNPYTEEEKKTFHNWVADGRAADVYLMMLDHQEKYIALGNSAEKGQKTKFKDAIRDLISTQGAQIQECLEMYLGYITDSMHDAASELVADLNDAGKELLKRNLTDEQMEGVEWNTTEEEEEDE